MLTMNLHKHSLTCVQELKRLNNVLCLNACMGLCCSNGSGLSNYNE